MLGQLSAAISASRSIPAPKCGMMNGTPGAVAARRATPSGSPRRRSNRLASPSLRRTPTESTPQWTKTAVPGCMAASWTTCSTRPSSSGTWCMAGNRQIPRSPSSSIARRERATGSGDEGSSMKKPTNRSGCFVARDTGNQRRPAHAMRVELTHPGVGKRVGAAGRIPVEIAAHFVGKPLVEELVRRQRRWRARVAPATLPRQSGEKLRGEEVAVTIVDDHVMQNSECKMQKSILNSEFSILHCVSLPPPHRRENRGDEDEADRESDPETRHAPPENETEHVPDREAEHPVPHHIGDHRRPRVAGAAENAGGDRLSAVEELEGRGNRQQPDADLDDP